MPSGIGQDAAAMLPILLGHTAHQQQAALSQAECRAVFTAQRAGLRARRDNAPRPETDTRDEPTTANPGLVGGRSVPALRNSSEAVHPRFDEIMLGPNGCLGDAELCRSVDARVHQEDPGVLLSAARQGSTTQRE